MMVLTRWVVDPDVCGDSSSSYPIGGGSLTPGSGDALYCAEQSLVEESSSDAGDAGVAENGTDDVLVGGWFIEGPGIAPTTISLTDPAVPNLELIAKVFFTMKIVDRSVSF